MLALLLALAWFEVPKEIERQTAAGKPYAQAFREVVGSLDDVAAAYAVRAIRDQPALVAEDDARRYVIEKDVQIGPLCGLVVRPRKAPARLATLLELTIYADWDTLLAFSARMAASHGYAAVVALVRGKGCGEGQPVPYATNPDDAVAAIDWIARQPWSDGRVGMFGGSYSGGAAWAAAKRMPKALKTIAVGAPVGPGIDVPMENGIFWNFVYPWPFFTTDGKWLDNAIYNDRERWQRLDREYYLSGRRYRDLPAIDGKPNPVFESWIAHPEYDSFWQAMIPWREEFARIDIPILQTAGYYSGGPGAATYYFEQHYRYRPAARHYLVVGPWDHGEAQHGTLRLNGRHEEEIDGYPLDPAARIDLEELRYQWFDHVFKGKPRPALIADRVNYEVTGANRWKHAPSLKAMARSSLRLKLGRAREIAVDYRERGDVDRAVPGGKYLDKAIETRNGVLFETAPFEVATEISGLLAGHLDFQTNKQSLDCQIDLYALSRSGQYFALAPWWGRVRGSSVDFRGMRLMSHLLQPGDRVVAVLRVLKELGRQINYGSAREVSDQSLAEDAGEPLRVRWLASSYLDLPIALPAPANPTSRHERH
ncbi:MAG TPA: CocE/NonD family hydrolase [Myxococcales bacterium]|nr:CocE/NonD family hydrolase [Myxococcales bacterium]